MKEPTDLEIPLPYLIRESSHRIHNAFTELKFAELGEVIGLRAAPSPKVLDLACGSGAMLNDWARDIEGLSGVGVDISATYIAAARQDAVRQGVADRVEFVHADAAGHVAAEPVDVAACVGATWIGDGVAGTVDLLRRSLKPGGMMLIGEPYWRLDPPDEATVRGCYAETKEDFLALPELLEHFAGLGCDVVEMILAGPDDWDRYVAPQWLNTRRWLDANPGHELWDTMRAELDTAPARYARYPREYLGWGVFVLMDR